MNMDRIFSNLIGNSIKYRSQERIPILGIKNNVVKGKSVIVFSDNGLGIDLKKQGEKLFGLGKTFYKQ